MVCESWKAKLDTYLDGELPEEEIRSFDAHVRSCPSCAADALTRVQMKRAIQAARKRYTPSAAASAFGTLGARRNQMRGLRTIAQRPGRLLDLQGLPQSEAVSGLISEKNLLLFTRGLVDQILAEF